jgi:hypothetical protein
MIIEDTFACCMVRENEYNRLSSGLQQGNEEWRKGVVVFFGIESD